MDIMEAMRCRHSVRRYKDTPIEGETLALLQQEISRINEESGLHIQLVLNEPKAFDCAMARYGKFSGVNNYIALVGKNDTQLQEKTGYYGERLVLYAQQLGLHTCWVALTYKKIPQAFTVQKGEKLAVVISVGYGKLRGLPRKSKSAEEVSNITPQSPDWFRAGVEGALLAPTAMNQQKFTFTLMPDGSVRARAGVGFYTKMDLGIARYHFEVASGKEIRWIG
ncbi:MAG: nitroreductase [Clostridia bacterium]|nr:nitroreductase [Clostridia bacterium]